MAKKVRFYHLWSTKEIIISITIPVSIMILLGLLFYHQELIDYYQKSKYEGMTIGEIKNYEVYYGMSQSHLGNKPQITKIKIYFSYNVDGKSIESERLIEGTKGNLRQLGKVINGRKTDVIVLYEIQQPTNYIIRLGEE